MIPNPIRIGGMLHPDTELRFVSDDIGYGIFATKLIPKGTITWVKDDLDRIISKEDLHKFSPAIFDTMMKYTYRDANGDFVFCWDLTRYVNHSFSPNSMPTALGFEIAIRDILPGEEMTNDYGTLNIQEPFECQYDPVSQRGCVYPDDLARYYEQWDNQIAEAFPLLIQLEQPLYKYLTQKQVRDIELIKLGKELVPSILNNLYKS